MAEFREDISWKNKFLNEQKACNILLQQYQTANKWIELLCTGVTIREKLSEWGIESILIYGASEFALRLIQCCEKEKIDIAAITDKRITAKDGFYKNIPLVPVNSIQDYVNETTFIVITAMGYCKEIQDELNAAGVSRMITLKQLLYGKDRG